MKKLIYVLAAVVLLLVIAVVAVVSMVNTDDVKQLIVKQVAEQTGRELVIAGDLSWRFFPSLGFEISQVALKDHPDFSSQDTLSLGLASASVAISPLFSQRIELGEIVVEGLALRYEVAQDGSSNFDDLTQQQAPATESSQTEQSASASESSGSAGLAGWQVQLAGLRVEDAKVVMVDHSQGTQQYLGPVNFTLESLDLGKPNQLALSLVFKNQEIELTESIEAQLVIAPDFGMVELKQIDGELKLSGEALPNGGIELLSKLDLSFELAKSVLSLSNLDLVLDEQVQLLGSVVVSLADVPHVQYALNIPELNLNPYLAESSESSSNGETSDDGKSASEPAQEPDLSALSLVNTQGELSIGKLQMQEIKVSNILLEQKLNAGVLELSKLAADLYQGSLNASFKLDSNPKLARFSTKAKLAKVNALSLMKDAAQLEVIDGTLNADLSLSGQGLTDPNLRKSITGPINATFTDGAIYGVNIPQMIRSASAKIKGGDVNQAQQEQKTDFSELVLNTKMGKAQANVTKVNMQSPLLRIDGKGKSHLVKESLDFAFDTKVVGSLQGQGGKNDLAGVNIPLTIKGTWSAPKVNLDFEKLLQGEVKKTIEKELNKVIKDDEATKGILNSLGGFLN